MWLLWDPWGDGASSGYSQHMQGTPILGVASLLSNKALGNSPKGQRVRKDVSGPSDLGDKPSKGLV